MRGLVYLQGHLLKTLDFIVRCYGDAEQEKYAIESDTGWDKIEMLTKK